MQHPLVFFKYYLVLFIAIMLVSCRAISLDHNIAHIATKTPVALGMIGLQEGKVFSPHFEVTTIPKLNEKIRVLATKTSFNKSTYKNYSKASPENKQQIAYVDSLDNKPSYFALEIIDKVTYQKELQNDTNGLVMSYLKTQNDAKVVSAIAMAFSQEVQTAIERADVLFLINKKQKQYSLELVKDNNTFATIDFHEGTIFKYELSYFCWGTDKRKKVLLFDIVDQNSSCPGQSYKTAIKAEEKSVTSFKL